MDKDKQYHYKNFNAHISEILSIYNKRTGQEDYTDDKRYQVDNSGKKFNQYQKENWEMLDAIERARTAFRFAMSKWL